MVKINNVKTRLTSYLDKIELTKKRGFFNEIYNSVTIYLLK